VAGITDRENAWSLIKSVQLSPSLLLARTPLVLGAYRF